MMESSPITGKCKSHERRSKYLQFSSFSMTNSTAGQDLPNKQQVTGMVKVGVGKESVWSSQKHRKHICVCPQKINRQQKDRHRD